MPYKDKEKQKEYYKRYYRLYQSKWQENNRDKTRIISKRFKRFRQDAILLYKSERGCKRCKMKDGRCLEFHHRDPKTKLFSISGQFITNSWEKLLIEMEKCDIVCANCHRILHAEERMLSDELMVEKK